jgi:hypothetical protein
VRGGGEFIDQEIRWSLRTRVSAVNIAFVSVILIPTPHAVPYTVFIDSNSRLNIKHSPLNPWHSTKLKSTFMISERIFAKPLFVRSVNLRSAGPCADTRTSTSLRGSNPRLTSSRPRTQLNVSSSVVSRPVFDASKFTCLTVLVMPAGLHC